MNQEGNTSAYLPREVEMSHTWIFPGILFPTRKHIQIKIGKLANNPVLLAIDRVPLPRLPRYTVTICVHKLIVPPGALTLLSRKC